MGNIVEPKYIQSLDEKPLTYEEMMNRFKNNGRAVEAVNEPFDGQNSYFQNQNLGQKTRKQNRFTFGKFITLLFLFLGIGIFGLGIYFFTSAKTFSNISNITGENSGDIFSGLFKSLTKPTSNLAGKNDGKTNILLVGVDSSGGLADTIQILSYEYNSKNFTSYTIPRDLRVKIDGGVSKINEAYVYAEQERERSGPEKIAKLVENEWGVKIHYWVEVNFDAVEGFINDVGGIDINVPNGFTDCQFPKKDYSGLLPCQTFNQGLQQMDGQTALIYARSRHGNNGEASDFKRSERQQLVLQALMEKVRKDGGKNIFSFNKITNYLDNLGKNVRVSLKTNEIKSFYEGFVKELADSAGKMKRVNFTADDKLFTSANINGYYIIYADGGFPGASGFGSVSRNQVKKIFSTRTSGDQNIVWNDKSVIVLANKAEKTKEIIRQISNTELNFCDTCYNNLYPYAKSTKEEKVTIYIEDDATRDAFKKAMSGKLNFEYSLEKNLPNSRILTSNNQGTDIIIWIE